MVAHEENIGDDGLRGGEDVGFGEKAGAGGRVRRWYRMEESCQEGATRRVQSERMKDDADGWVGGRASGGEGGTRTCVWIGTRS